MKKYHGDLNGIDTTKWRVSDDTVMHLASLKGMISFEEKFNPHREVFKFSESNREENVKFMREFVDPLMREMGQEYLNCWVDMYGRAPGPTCKFFFLEFCMVNISGEKGVRFLHEFGLENWEGYAYDKRGGGNGGSVSSSIAIQTLNHLYR